MRRALLLALGLLLVGTCGEEEVPDYCYERGSSCGCTKYRKSECGRDECCGWVTGKGCRCRG